MIRRLELRWCNCSETKQTSPSFLGGRRNVATCHWTLRWGRSGLWAPSPARRHGRLLSEPSVQQVHGENESMRKLIISSF